MIKACIYIPADVAADGSLAADGRDYLFGQGYEYAGHARDPDVVDHFLATGQATVVLLLTRDHLVEGRAWPVELVPGWDAPLISPAVRRRNEGSLFGIGAMRIIYPTGRYRSTPPFPPSVGEGDTVRLADASADPDGGFAEGWRARRNARAWGC